MAQTPLLPDDVRPGAVFRDPETGEVTYTVERVLHNDAVNGLQLLVRFEVDGGTDIRVFEFGQPTLLTEA